MEYMRQPTELRNTSTVSKNNASNNVFQAHGVRANAVRGGADHPPYSPDLAP
jgi:hypothetical protein